jgi:NADH-quinone oxidoreductase subunit E
MSVRRLAEKQPASFAFTAENLSWAKAQIGKYPEGRQQSAVIPILWRAQEQCGGWLPQKAIEATADLLGMAKIRVLEVATFYTMFNLAPVGRFHVQLCGTTPCMLRGSEELKKVCRRMIGEENHVTADGAFSWIEVECLGACVNAPMVQINADYYEDLTPELLTRIINDLSAGRMPKPGPQIDRINSAPIGGPTTLTDPALFAANGKRAQGGASSSPDDETKKPGQAASLRDAPMPKPPAGDATDPGRN